MLPKLSAPATPRGTGVAANVSLTRAGVLDGGHERSVSWAQAGAMTFRPALAFCRDCKRLQFRQVTLRDPMFWSLHLRRCRDVLVEGVQVRPSAESRALDRGLIWMRRVRGGVVARARAEPREGDRPAVRQTDCWGVAVELP